jgi:transposase
MFVGIDISKFKHVVAIINESKQLIGKVFEITESAAGYQQLLVRLEQHQCKNQSLEFRIGMEATGDYWKNLYHFLVRQSSAFVVTVINPVQTKRFAQSELRRAKTDAVNAIDIARFMAEKKPRPTVSRPALFDNLKDLDRQIHALQKQQTMTLNKLRAELAKVAPEIEHHLALAHHQQVLVLLKNYPTAAAIARASPEELRNLRYGKRQWRLSVSFITKVQALAKNSIASKSGPGSGLVVQALVEQLVYQQQLVLTLKAHISQLYESVKEQSSLLETIPGIARETAIALEAYIGDIARFPSAKKLVAYFGLNPTVNLSGLVTVRSAAPLQKKGCAIVRHKLFMAVLSMISNQVEPFYGYYQRMVSLGKPKLVAIVATMRKLLVIIYTMLKKQQPFIQKNKKTS